MEFHNEFSEDISIAKGLPNEEMFSFSDIIEIQGETACITEKNHFGGIEVSEV